MEKLFLGVFLLFLGAGLLLNSVPVLALGLVLLAALQLVAHCRRERQLAQLIQELTRMQDNTLGFPLDHCREGQLGILYSELYKLVNQLREQAAAAAHGKGYMADMLADISHQLKTPLTALGILMDILGAPELEAEKRLETVSKAEAQRNKVNWLIRSLLVLSQLDAGVLELKPAPCDLCKLLDSVCQSLDVLAEVQEVTLRRDYGPGPVSLSCDWAWTREALSNLVKNCVEHSPGGRVELSVVQHNFSTTITIRDNGHGIPKEELPHIFERFYKGRNSTPNSAGLGLALANQIILKQNGILSAQSQEGVGTCFTVKFYSPVKL